MDYAPLEGPECIPFTKAIKNVLVRTAWISLSSSEVGQARDDNRRDDHTVELIVSKEMMLTPFPPTPSNREQVMMTNLTSGYKGLRSTATTGSSGGAPRSSTGMDLCRWLREHGMPRVKWTGWIKDCYLIFTVRRRKSRRPRNVSSVKSCDNFLSFISQG